MKGRRQQKLMTTNDPSIIRQLLLDAQQRRSVTLMPLTNTQIKGTMID